jgi:hypothetical protein
MGIRFNDWRTIGLLVGLEYRERESGSQFLYKKYIVINKSVLRIFETRKYVIYYLCVTSIYKVYEGKTQIISFCNSFEKIDSMCSTKKSITNQ